MDREAWWAIVHGVAKSWTRLKRLSTLKTTLNTSSIVSFNPHNSAGSKSEELEPKPFCTHTVHCLY